METETNKDNKEFNNKNANMTGPVDITPKSGDFDTLVLSGGSIHSINSLGALQYAEDNYLLNKVTTYIGTSAGAMCSYLLAIGYNPIEIMVYLCTKQVLERMKHFNIVAMINGSGATSYSHVNEQLEKMTIEKIGRLITLGELRSMFGKTLICITHNISDDKMEMLGPETYPNMPCLIALRMSSNLPFIFDHFKYMGNFYIDGGVSNTFPIDIGDKIGNKILGVVLNDTKVDFKENMENTIDYIYKLLHIPIRQSIKNKINKASNKCTIIKIKKGKQLMCNFSLNTNDKLEMFSDGYTQMKTYWENN
jgi:predicted acylesterase/phospholipase RssA